MNEWDQIIHNNCGLPIEFCVCLDATIKINKGDDFWCGCDGFEYCEYCDDIEDDEW